MTDASDEPPAGRTTEPSADASATEDDDQSVEDLRRQVEAKYDFENFSEADMAEISPEEWDVAFDADTWITGDEPRARRTGLKTRIAYREVFAMLEYAVVDGRRSLVAYSDTDYAIIFPDGTVEGRGTVVRDVKPTVALCSMESYDVEEPPADWHLPEPADLEGEHSELGNWMLQLLAIALARHWGHRDRDLARAGAPVQLILGVVGIVLVVISLVLFLMVANARLSDRFRTEAYESRLRTIGSGDRPSFLPIDDEAFERDAPPRNRSPLEE
ncbi:hypothetical protein ACFQMM_17760 [Saliphagus sp. GCM10025308]